jgi:hypothetical protein
VTPAYPLADIPIQRPVDLAGFCELRVAPSRVFDFDEIREAHRVLDAQSASGKMGVVVRPDHAACRTATQALAP